MDLFLLGNTSKPLCYCKSYQKPDNVLKEIEGAIDRMGTLGFLVIIRKELDALDDDYVVRLNRMLELAFLEGHKQARHAAAELASEEVTNDI